MFGGGSVVPTIKSGKLRGLATTGACAIAADCRTCRPSHEIYPGFEALSWHGVFAPAGTPQPIVDRLREELKAVAAQPEFKERLANTGSGEPYVVPRRGARRAHAARLREIRQADPLDRREGGVARR